MIKDTVDAKNRSSSGVKYLSEILKAVATVDQKITAVSAKNSLFNWKTVYHEALHKR